MEGNSVSADVAEAESELVGFSGVVAIDARRRSRSSRKINCGFWGKNGVDRWGKSWEGGWCVDWWGDDGEDWLGWSDCWGSNNLRGCQGWHVEAERVDGGDVESWGCDHWWLDIGGCACRWCDGGRGVDDDGLVDGNTVTVAALACLDAGGHSLADQSDQNYCDHSLLHF